MCPRMLVHPDVREHLQSSCDVGSSPEELTELFPHVSFTDVEKDWWRPRDQDGKLIQPEADAQCDGERVIVHEPDSSLKERVARFRSWCIRQPETCIAVFAHCHFIRH